MDIVHPGQIQGLVEHLVVLVSGDIGVADIVGGVKPGILQIPAAVLLRRDAGGLAGLRPEYSAVLQDDLEGPTPGKTQSFSSTVD